jgi:hypothetical protein
MTTTRVSPEEEDASTSPKVVRIAERGSPHRSEWFSRLVELSLLCMTLTTTAVFNYFILREMRHQSEINAEVLDQTRQHFAIQRTSAAIERFNSDQLLQARHLVDAWLGTGESPGALMDRAVDPTAAKTDSEKTPAERLASERAAKADEALQAIRVFANFFQELGTAFKHDTLHEQYAWDVFGSLVIRYEGELRPFVMEMRRRRNRPKMYQEFMTLAETMRRLDQKYTSKP